MSKVKPGLTHITRFFETHLVYYLHLLKSDWVLLFGEDVDKGMVNARDNTPTQIIQGTERVFVFYFFVLLGEMVCVFGFGELVCLFRFVFYGKK